MFAKISQSTAIIALIVGSLFAQESQPTSGPTSRPVAVPTVLPDELFLEIAGQGPSAQVVARGRSVLVMDVIARLAELLRVKIVWENVESQSNFAEAAIDLDIGPCPMREFLWTIGAASDLFGRYDDRSATITFAVVPDAATAPKERAAFFRKFAVDLLRRETTVPERDASETPELLRRAAMLAAADADYSGALADLESSLQAYPNDSEGPDTCLLGIRMALAAGRGADARRLGDRFLETWRRHEYQRRIEYLLAQSFHIEGRRQEAVLLLERIDRAIARGDAPERDGMIGELLLAEIYSEMGDHRHAVQVLERVPGRHSREQKDLLRRLPLYLGICRSRAGDYDAAVLDLVVASHEAPTQRLRMHALLYLSRAYLALKLPFESYAALKMLRRIGVAEDLEFETLELEARSLTALGLDSRSVEAWIKALEFAAKADTNPEQRKSLLESVLSEIAHLLVEAQEFRAAEDIITKLKALDHLDEGMIYMSALCRFHTGRYEEALRELETVPSDKGLLVEERRQLVGDCQMRLAQYETAVRTFQTKEENQ